MNFGRKMLEFRAKHNLTQKQLAELFGVDVNTVYRTETEKTEPIKVNKIKFENKMKEYEEEKRNGICM